MENESSDDDESYHSAYESPPPYHNHHSSTSHNDNDNPAYYYPADNYYPDNYNPVNYYQANYIPASYYSANYYDNPSTSHDDNQRETLRATHASGMEESSDSPQGILTPPSDIDSAAAVRIMIALKSVSDPAMREVYRNLVHQLAANCEMVAFHINTSTHNAQPHEDKPPAGAVGRAGRRAGSAQGPPRGSGAKRSPPGGSGAANIQPGGSETKEIHSSGSGTNRIPPGRGRAKGRLPGGSVAKEIPPGGSVTKEIPPGRPRAQGNCLIQKHGSNEFGAFVSLELGERNAVGRQRRDVVDPTDDTAKLYMYYEKLRALFGNYTFMVKKIIFQQKMLYFEMVLGQDCLTVLRSFCYGPSKLLSLETEYKRLLHYSWLEDWTTVLNREFIGKVVVTTYNNKTYRIQEVLFNETPMTTFSTVHYKLSFDELFRTHRCILIRDIHQPMLICKRSGRREVCSMKEAECLVPELCMMAGIRADIRADVHNLLTSLLNASARVEAARTTARYIESQITVQKDIKNCEWVVITPRRLERDVNDLIREILAMTQLQIPTPTVLVIEDDHPSHLLEAIELVISIAKPDMIFLAVSDISFRKYAAITAKFFLDRGLCYHVLVIGRTLVGENLRSAMVTKKFVSKEANQINIKLTGNPWKSPVYTKDVMVVGIDICQDRLDKSKWFGAMVTTTNPQLTTWFNTTFPYSIRQQLLICLSLETEKVLRRWVRMNGSLPARVVVYRYGVGDDKMRRVNRREVKSVKKGMQKVYGKTPLRLGFIVVVNKVIRSLPKDYLHRLYGGVESYNDPGTIHAVIEDSLDWELSQLQNFSNFLGYNHYNDWVIRLPAPLLYAHKLSIFLAHCLHEKPHANLCDKLFYI